MRRFRCSCCDKMVIEKARLVGWDRKNGAQVAVCKSCDLCLKIQKVDSVVMLRRLLGAY